MTALDNLLGEVITQSESLAPLRQVTRLTELTPASSRGKGERVRLFWSEDA